jgi:ankyrin repeat domain-containing protein 50
MEPPLLYFLWLLIVFSIIVNASASGLDDFANNLATDIGPLLSLFGEQITIQYFSESTSYLDYFIFAMAPIGIVTAMTSAIRVCGDSSLRAFIGRAQEGDGAIEAELCTSTSRDVCELFHRGGIVRVFGRPTILEIVRLSGVDPSTTENERYTMGTYLFKYYLIKKKKNPKAAAWLPKENGGRFSSFKTIIAFVTPLTRLWKRLLGAREPKEHDLEHIGNPSKTPLGMAEELAPKQTSMEANRKDSSNAAGQPDNPGLFDEGSDSDIEMLAQNPNISINIGITKLPTWFLALVALVGFLLQSGVIVMAAIMSWKLEWTLDGAPLKLVDEKTAISDNRSPISFIIGTVCLCSGILACAALIGETTKEMDYFRNDSQPSRLFWVQPGNQTIGEETFDAFAYLEDVIHSPLPKYTTSSKNKGDFNDSFYIYTWIAVIISLGGYIAQFIGLRGMNASISVAQLGVTVLMSILRASLRLRRLKSTDNQLANVPDMVRGHELDWLAFEIADLNDQKPRDEKSGSKKMASAVMGSISQSETKRRKTCGWAVTSKRAEIHGSNNDQTNEAERLLRYRTRLADLTEHSFSVPSNSIGTQFWDNDQVIVRLMSKNLATALCAAADALISVDENQSDLTLEVDIQLWTLEQDAYFDISGNEKKSSPATPDLLFSKKGPIQTPEPNSQTIEIVLSPQKGVTPKRWGIDSARLEGILGLWVWSLKQSQGLQEKDQHGNWLSIADEIPMARIIQASEQPVIHGVPSDFEAMEDELNLWLGQSLGILTLSKGKLNRPPPAKPCDSSTLWTSDGEIPQKVWKPLERKGLRYINDFSGRSHEKRHPVRETRFFGWQNIEPKTQKTEGELQILYMDTESTANPKHDILEQCCRDVYSILLQSLVSEVKCQFDEVTVLGTADHIRLDEPKITAMVTAFIENNLGSYTDAILCIIPVVRNHMKLKKSESLESSLMKVLRQKDGHKIRAETLLGWIHLHSEDSKGPQEKDGQEMFLSSLIAVCESYRRGFDPIQPDVVRQSAYLKLGQLIQKYRKDLDGNGDEVEDVLSRYEIIAIQRAEDTHDKYPFERSLAMKLKTPIRPLDLVKMIQEGKRTETLYLLCIVGSDMLRQNLENALPLAAQNGWNEVVRALLGLGAVVDGQDEDNRTAISHYCAQKGAVSMVKELLEFGSHADLPDKNSRTPLLWAAKTGDYDVVKALCETGKVIIDSADDKGRSPLSWAAENNYREVVRLLRESGTIKLDLADYQGRTPFSYAAGQGHYNIIKDLSNNRLVNLNSKDDNGLTPLSWASINGHVDAVKTLISLSEIKPQVSDDQQRTPLEWAVEKEYVNVVLELLNSNKVEQTAKNMHGLIPLACAARKGSAVMVDTLLAHCNPSVLQTTDNMDRTAVWWAFKNGNLQVAKRLLQNQSFDLNQGDSAGNTPILWGARNGHEDIVQFLLEQKVDPSIRNNAGQTPVWWAVRRGHMNIVRMLLKNNRAVAEERGSFGRTPLMWAARLRNTEMVKLLLKEGEVDLTMRDDDGRGALSWALEANDLPTIAVLQEAMKQKFSKYWASEVDFYGRTYLAST